MSQQIQNGEVKPDDIVREDPFIFIPESRLDETTRQKLDIQDEILEDENGNIITPQNQVNQQQDNNEAESENESDQQDNDNNDGESDNESENEVAIRKSVWDKFAADNPEMAATLQDVIRIGVKGVTAAEELANKFKNFVETANNNPEIKAEKERLFNELVNTGRNPQEARGLVDVAGAFADTLNKRYGVDVQQAMNLIAKPNNQVQENNNNEAATPAPAPVITPATKQGSNTARIRTIQGTEIDIRYRIVEADSLITSNLENGGINPDYSQELQPRDRSRDASIEEIAKISTNLDPELLGESRLASDGAPIIGSDLMVESGNGRTLAIRQAYKNGTAQNYRNWLMNNAQYFGLNPDEIANMNNPVLVRERLTDIDRAKFSAANLASNGVTVNLERYNQAKIANRDGIYNGLRLPFNPNDLKTESGRSIDEADKSELLLTPDGSSILGTIPAINNEFPAGIIQANVGVIHYIERIHGKDLSNFNYDNAQSLLLDILNNYMEIRQAKGKALFLAVQGSKNHSVKSVVKLVETGKGIYTAIDAGPVNNSYLNNKPLLYTRSGPIAADSGSGMAYPNGASQVQNVPQSYARQQSNNIIARESYNQLINEQGARNLDAIDEGERIANLEIAKQMLEQGWDNTEIKAATGWGLTNLGWSYEIQDGTMTDNFFEALILFYDYSHNNISEQEYKDGLIDLFGHDNITLGDILKNSEMYDAYPDLQDMPVVIDNEIIAYDLRSTLKISPSYIAAYPQVLFHEIRHAIQQREGLINGSNGFIFDDAVKSGNYKGEQLDYLYWRANWEADARNVANRANLTEDERESTPLNDTQDLLSNQQLNTAQMFDEIKQGSNYDSDTLARLQRITQEQKSIREKANQLQNDREAFLNAIQEIQDNQEADNESDSNNSDISLLDILRAAAQISKYISDNPNAETIPADLVYDEILPSINIENDDDYDNLLQELENNGLLVPAKLDDLGMTEEFALPDRNLLARFTETGNNEINNDYTDIQQDIPVMSPQKEYAYLSSLLDTMPADQWYKKYGPRVHELKLMIYQEARKNGNPMNPEMEAELAKRENTEIQESPVNQQENNNPVQDLYLNNDGSPILGNINGNDIIPGGVIVGDSMIESFIQPQNQDIFYDVVINGADNYNNIYQGDNDSFLLVKKLEDGNNAALEVVYNDGGFYKIQNARFISDQDLAKKSLLSVRSEPSIINPAADESLRTIPDNAGEITPTAEQLKNSDNNLTVNPENVHENISATPENVKARTSWPAGTSSVDTQSIIEFFTNADESSGFHELAHHIFRVLTDSAVLDNASDELINDVQIIFKNAGVSRDDFYNNKNNARESAHEYFAKAFEAYLSEGNAPTQELQSTFDKIKSWLIDIYHDVIQALGIELNDEMRNIFDKLLTTPEQEASKLSIQDLQARLDATQQELANTQNEISQLEQQIQDLHNEMLIAQEDAYNTGFQSGKQTQQEKDSKQISKLEGRIEALEFKRKQDLKQQKAKLKERLEKKLAKLKEKYKLLQTRQKERQKIKRERAKAIKAINYMAQSQNIIWSSQQEIKALLQDYNLKELRKVSSSLEEVQDLYIG